MRPRDDHGGGRDCMVAAIFRILTSSKGIISLQTSNSSKWGAFQHANTTAIWVQITSIIHNSMRNERLHCCEHNSPKCLDIPAWLLLDLDTRLGHPRNISSWTWTNSRPTPFINIHPQSTIHNPQSTSKSTSNTCEPQKIWLQDKIADRVLQDWWVLFHLSHMFLERFDVLWCCWWLYIDQMTGGLSVRCAER